MNKSEHHYHNWAACEPGTLSALSGRARRRTRQRRVLATTGLLVSGAACVVIGMSYFGSERGLRVPGVASPDHLRSVARMSCAEVLDCRDSYLLGNVSDEIRASVREHLGHCPHCQGAYQHRAQTLNIEYSVLVAPGGHYHAYAMR